MLPRTDGSPSRSGGPATGGPVRQTRPRRRYLGGPNGMTVAGKTGDENVTDTSTPQAEEAEQLTAPEAVEEKEGGAADTAPAGDLFRESEIAADYVEGLLDILDYDGDIDELVSERAADGRGRRWPAQRARRAARRHAGGAAGADPAGDLPPDRYASRLLLDVGGYRAAAARNWRRSPRTRSRRSRSTASRYVWSRCRRSSASASTTSSTRFRAWQSESEGVEPSRRIVVRPAG